MPPKKSKSKEETYEVEAVVDRRRTAENGIEYLIKWKGHVDTSWEPKDLCNCIDLINDYKRRFMPPNGTHSPPPPLKKEGSDAAPTTSNKRGRPRKQPPATPSSSLSSVRGKPQLSSQKKQQNKRKASVSVKTESDDDDESAASSSKNTLKQQGSAKRRKPASRSASSDTEMEEENTRSRARKDLARRSNGVTANQSAGKVIKTESVDDDDESAASSSKKTPKQQGSAKRRKPVSSSASSDTEKEDEEENTLSRSGKDSARRPTRVTGLKPVKVEKVEMVSDDDAPLNPAKQPESAKRRRVDDVGSSSSAHKGASTSTSAGRKPVYRSVKKEPKEENSAARRYDDAAKRASRAANRMSSGSFAISVGGSKVHMQRSSKEEAKKSTDDSSVIVTAVRRRGPRRTGPTQPLSLEDMLVSTLIGNPYIIPLTWESIVGYIHWKDQELSLLGSAAQYDAEFASKPRKLTPADFPGITVWDEASYQAAGHSLTPLAAGKAQPPGDEKEKEDAQEEEEEEGEQFGGREVVRVTAFVYDEKDPFVLVFLAPKENERVSDAVQAVHAHLATRLFPKAYDDYRYRVGQLLVPSLASSASSSTKDDEPGPSTRAGAGRSEPNTPRTRAGPSTSATPTGRGRRSEQ